MHIGSIRRLHVLRYRYAADVHHWICDERWVMIWVLCDPAAEGRDTKGITCTTTN